MLLMSPAIPLLFMGDEWGSTQPFLFFTDHRDALADAVREGRRREFADFSAFEDPAQRERIPDPNALTTYEASRLDDDEASAPEHRRHQARFRQWLALRHEHLVPWLKGSCAIGARVLGDKAVEGRWSLGNGHTLTIAINLSPQPVSVVWQETPLVCSRDGVDEHIAEGRLPARTSAVWLQPSGDVPGEPDV